MKNNFLLTVFLMLGCALNSLSQNIGNWKGMIKSNLADFDEIEEAFWEEFPTLTDTEKLTELKQFQRFKRTWESRSECNNIVLDGKLSAYETILKEYLQDGTPCDDPEEPHWNCIGPFSGPEPDNLGRVTAIWAYSQNPDVLLCAGDEGSGIWKSTDGGLTWQNKTDNLWIPGLGCGKIISKPDDENVLFASMGNTNLMREHYGPGLLKSEDMGESWFPVYSLEVDEHHVFFDIEFSATDPNKLYSIGYAGDGSQYVSEFGIYDLTLDTDPENNPNSLSWSIVPIVSSNNQGFGTGNEITDLEIMLDDNLNEILVISGRSEWNVAKILYSANEGLEWIDISANLTGSENWLNNPDLEDNESNAIGYSDSGWSLYANVSGENNVAGYSQAIVNENNWIRNTDAEIEINANVAPYEYEYCMEYQVPALAGLEIALRFYQPPLENYYQSIAQIPVGTQSATGSICIIIDDILMDQFVSNYVDFAVSQGDDAEEAMESVTNGEIQIRVRALADPNFEYVNDADYSDLIWIDNLSFYRLGQIDYGRIQLSKSVVRNGIYAYYATSDQQYKGIDFLDNDLIFHHETTISDGGDYGGGYWNSIFAASPYTDNLFYGGVSLGVYDTELHETNNQIGVDLHDDKRSIHFLPPIEPGYDHLVIGTDGGPSRSTDSGDNWTHLDNLPITQFYGIGVAENAEWLAAGTQDNHLFVRNGSDWIQKDQGDCLRIAMSDSKNRAYYFSNDAFSATARELNSNGSYSFYGMNSLPDAEFFSSNFWLLDKEVVEDVSNPGVYYTSFGHLYRFDENSPGCENFSACEFEVVPIPGSDVLPNEVPGFTNPVLEPNGTPYRQNINSIAFCRDVPGVIYAADASSVRSNTLTDVQLKLFKSVDNGTNWIDLSAANTGDQNIVLRQTLQHFGIRDILVSPENEDVVWLGFRGISTLDANGNSTGRVLKSLDGGVSWVDISDGLPPVHVHTLIYQDNAYNRVYAGTDLGIYFIQDGMAAWQCFSSGLPPCVVTGLDINTCTGKLLCSTYGRGIWETDLLPSAPLHIEANTIWTLDKHIDRSIVIDQGATLTIDNATVYMSGGTRIFVELGGHLIVDQGIVRPEECTQSWQGIELGGMDDEVQTTALQGKVTLINGSIVQGAEIGISNLDSWSTTNDYSGGIVEAIEAHFIDCKTGIKLSNFPKPGVYDDFSEIPANVSIIRNCSFEWTDDVYSVAPLEMTENADIYGIWLHQVKGINAEGCNFINTADNSGPYSSRGRGTGIYINTASAEAKALATEVGGLTEYNLNNFTGLTNGMYAITCDPSYTVKVDRAHFESCWYGVILEGQLLPQVTRCAFEVPHGWEYQPNQTPVGLYMNQCNLYEVEENTFTNDLTNGLIYQSGMVVKDSYQQNDLGFGAVEIYNNDFHNMKMGIDVEGMNDTDNMSDGLQIKCNNFTETNGLNDEYDIALTTEETRIAPEQGSPQDVSSPAGNIFTPANSEYNYFIDVDAVPLDAYWHHTPSAVYKLVPSPASNGVNPSDSQQGYIPEQSCPSLVSELVQDPQQHVVQFNTSKEDYATIRDVYSGLVDQGTPQELIAFIRDANNSSIDVRNEMLLHLPNSDLALREAMYRNPDLNAWHMAQVLIANSPLKPSVRTMMQQSGLEPFYQDLVEGAQTGGVSFKSILEADMAHYNLELSTARADYLRKYLRGENGTTAIQTNALLSDNEPAELRRLRIALLAREGDYTAALIELDECAQTTGGPDGYCEMQRISIEMLQAELTPQELSETDLSDLRTIAESGEAGSSQAYALLELATGERSEKVVHWPGTSRNLMFERKQERSEPNLVEVFPNPNKGFAQITYKMAEGVEKPELLVYDALGSQVYQQSLPDHLLGILDLDMRTWSSGTYKVFLLWDGIRVDEISLVIAK